MPLVAIILACEGPLQNLQPMFQRYHPAGTIRRSPLVLVFYLDQGTQFVKVPVDFHLFWSISIQLIMVEGDHFNCKNPFILIVEWLQIIVG